MLFWELGDYGYYVGYGVLVFVVGHYKYYSVVALNIAGVSKAPLMAYCLAYFVE